MNDYLKFLGIMLVFGGLIIIAALMESIHLELEATIAYLMFAIAIIVIGIICIIWDREYPFED